MTQHKAVQGPNEHDMLLKGTVVELHAVVSAVSIVFRVPKPAILSKDRRSDVRMARTVARYILRHHFGWLFRDIGLCFGCTEHNASTMDKRASGYIRYDTELRECMNQALAMLGLHNINRTSTQV